MENIEHWKDWKLRDIIEVVDGITYTEEWKFIVGFENVYSISTFGRIKSHARLMKVCGVLKYSPNIEKIRKLSVTEKGYLSIRLKKDGNKIRNFSVHRLVGIYFIPNPDNLPEVNHLKGIKTDNRYHKLEWSTHLDNCKHCYDTGIYVISDKQRKAVGDKNRLYCGIKHYMSKRVINTETGVVYNSASEAAKAIGMNLSTLYSKLNRHYTNETNLIYG